MARFVTAARRSDESAGAPRSTFRPRQPTPPKYGMGLIHIELFATLDLAGQAPGRPDEDPVGFPFGGGRRPCLTTSPGRRSELPTRVAPAAVVAYFHRKWTKIRPKLSESFSTRW